MKQTEKYKFNLIETSDAFSPTPLNENAETAEAQLAALEDVDAAAAAAISALNADVHPGAFGQVVRIATGTYVGQCITGANSPSSLEFDFKPMLVFICPTYDTSVKDYQIIMIRPGLRSFRAYADPCNVTWGEKSVTWSNTYPNFQCNYRDVDYTYIAIGVTV